MATERFNLDEMTSGQSGKYTTFNTALRQLEQQLTGVKSRTTDAQPGSPSAGDSYIITGSATGTDWAGYAAGSIAAYWSSAWHELTVDEGAGPLWVADEDVAICYDGSAWEISAIKDLQTLLDAKEALGTVRAINTQTGTTYTAVLTDAGKVVEMNNASANTITIPPNSSVAYPIGTWFEIVQYGAGQTTVAAGGGVTIRADMGLVVQAQYSGCVVYKRGTDEWVAIGDIGT